MPDSAVVPEQDSRLAGHPAGLRRTFAIISHPDAGKTTLTEKLLLFGGAIRAAGQVRARGEARRTRSDWMAIERARALRRGEVVATRCAPRCARAFCWARCASEREYSRAGAGAVESGDAGR